MGVAPRAGAWIEANMGALPLMTRFVAPRAGAWIEAMLVGISTRPSNKSLPVRERLMWSCIVISTAQTYRKNWNLLF